MGRPAPRRPRSLLVLSALLLAACPSRTPDVVDLVFHNASIWTGDAGRPRAGWIAVRGETIEALGDADDFPEAGRTIDLGGRLVLPGFNDSHVHFAQAGSLLLGVNLLDVSDDDGFRSRIAEAAAHLPAGSWITGGDWGAYEAWALGSDGRASGRTTYLPSRDLIDDLTPEHPVLVTRFDRAVGLANAVALGALGVESSDGRLEGEQLAAALRGIPGKTFERRVAEARRALEECRRFGVTTVQDMSPPDQVEIYEWLRTRGELTVRVHFSPSRLVEYEDMLARGWTVGAGDAWLRFGTIKTHIDGTMGGHTARFFEPYADNDPQRADWRGGWREFSHDLEAFERMLRAADAGGIQLRVHAIGDEANAILLDILDRLEAENDERDRRLRLVHAQVIREQDFPRFRGRGIVAEVQPYHCSDDMRWMEERIGRERCRGAYAFRSLLEHGCVLAFGSDWPGTHASYYPINPLLGLYAAVTRQTIEGTPPDGWFPEQRVTLEEALRAYTAAGAWATFEESLKGTLSPGKLADLVVLDTDLFETEPTAWLEAGVDFTVVGGKIVYHGGASGGIPPAASRAAVSAPSRATRSSVAASR